MVGTPPWVLVIFVISCLQRPARSFNALAKTKKPLRDLVSTKQEWLLPARCAPRLFQSDADLQASERVILVFLIRTRPTWLALCLSGVRNVPSTCQCSLPGPP